MSTDTTSPTPTRDSLQIANDLFAELADAWNAGDGAGYARPFRDDASFVNIRGELFRGTDTIAAGHQGIFDSIYKGSTVRYTVVSSEPLGEGFVIAIAEGHLEVPGGPLQGTYDARMTVLLMDTDGAWKVRSFHNTLVTA